jgi:uncharacterized protein YktA (UPF0223 family)
MNNIELCSQTQYFLDMPNVKYERKEIMKVLAILQSCGFNYYMAQSEVGIDRHTIMRWYKKYKDVMPVKKNKKDSMTIEDRKLEYEKNLLDAKERLLEAILKTTSGMRNVKYLAESLKIVTELEKENSSNPARPLEVRPNLLQTILKNVEKIEINNNTQILNANGTEND